MVLTSACRGRPTVTYRIRGSSPSDAARNRFASSTIGLRIVATSASAGTLRNAGHSVATTSASAPDAAASASGARRTADRRSSGSARTAGSCAHDVAPLRRQPPAQLDACRAPQRVGARLVGQAPDRHARAAQIAEPGGQRPPHPIRVVRVALAHAASSGVRHGGPLRKTARGTRRRARACRRQTRRPATRYARGPIRRSVFSPRSTSVASAPTSSHRTAISLMNATDVARNALIACLVISADSTDIHSICDAIGSNSAASTPRAASSRTPTTTRSGCVNASMALPSRRFSGEQANDSRRGADHRAGLALQLPRGARPAAATTSAPARRRARAAARAGSAPARRPRPRDRRRRPACRT